MKRTQDQEHEDRTQELNLMARVTTCELGFVDLVGMLQRGENFSLSRWGDGEWRSVLGRIHGANKDGHSYVAELGEELRKVLRQRPPYLLGLSRWEQVFGSGVDEWLIKEGLGDLNWIDAGILHKASIKGRLAEVVNALRQRPAWVVVGPEHLAAAQDVLKFDNLIALPPDCFSARLAIRDQLLHYAEGLPTNAVVTFSVGMTANLLIHDFFERYGNRITLIDAGSLWDPFAGVLSRTYMHAEGFTLSV